MAISNNKIPSYALIAAALWLLLQWLQAGFTALDPDEAYYWMYSRRLSWGYFDHPPLTALLIAMGQWLPGTWGVRFWFPIVQLVGFYGIWHLAGRPVTQKDLTLLGLLLISQPLMVTYGFVATPDGPLLTGAVLFWWSYKNWHTSPRLKEALLMGLAAAVLLYAKYHGGLVIGLAILSQLRQNLRRPTLYVAGIFALLLFLPHLYWQYVHDWPSFRYHLGGGRDDVYELRFTLEYFLNQLLIFNPFLFPFILIAWWQARDQKGLSKVFFWTATGLWLFFTWSTFKGSAEAHWTAVLAPAFILLLYNYLRKTTHERRYARVLQLSLFSAALLLLVRIPLMMTDLPLRTGFHDKRWVEDLQKHFDDAPIVFDNSYRYPSVYNFRTRDTASTITNSAYRPSQYDLWNTDEPLQDKTIWMVSYANWPCSECDSLRSGKHFFKFRKVGAIQIARKVKIEFPGWYTPFEGQKDVQLPVRLINPYSYDLRLNYGEMPLTLRQVYLEKTDHYLDEPVTVLMNGDIIPAKDTMEATLEFSVPSQLRPNSNFALGFRMDSLQAMTNSILLPVQ